MRHRALIIAGSIVAFCVAAYFMVPRIPGTLRIRNGVAWGTGTITYYYKRPPKPVQLIERYSAGTFSRSEWYDLDDNLVWAVDWDNGTGWGAYMRQDGTIKMRVFYEKGLNSSGKKIYFDPSGNKVSKDRYDEGELDNWGRGLDPYEFRWPSEKSVIETDSGAVPADSTPPVTSPPTSTPTDSTEPR